jgi:hypothetical protein
MLIINARTHQSTKAPMMYATKIPRANALAVNELRVPRIRGEAHSLICKNHRKKNLIKYESLFFALKIDLLPHIIT